jgi:hypothetical protein
MLVDLKNYTPPTHLVVALNVRRLVEASLWRPIVEGVWENTRWPIFWEIKAPHR